MSMANCAVPLILSGTSSRAIGLPMSLNCSGGRDRRLLDELDLGGVGRQRAVAGSAAGGFVRDLAVAGLAIGRRHIPALGRRGDEPFARRGAGLLQHMTGGAHARLPAVRMLP